MTEFTSMLVSPEKEHNEGVNAATVAQEWVSEHMLKKQGDKEAEAKMNRQVAERLALELRSKCELVADLKSKIASLEDRLTEESTTAADIEPLKQQLKEAAYARTDLEVTAEQLQNTLSQKDALLREAEAHCINFQKTITEADEENSTLRKAIEVQEQQLEERDAAIAKQKDAYQHLLDISRKVASQNQLLNTEAERLGSMVPSLQREVDTLKEQAKASDSLQQEAGRLASLAQMVPKLTDEINILRETASSVPTLEEERQLLIQACQQMSDEIPKLNAQIESLAKENASLPLLREEVQRLESIIQQLEKELIRNKMLEQEIDRLHGALGDAALIKKEFEKVSKDLEQIPALEANLRSATSLAEEVPGLIGLRDHLSSEVDKKEAELHGVRCNVQKETSELRAEVDSLRAKQSQYTARIKELQASNVQKDAMATHQLNTIAEPLAAEAKSLQAKVLSAEEQLRQQQHSHKEEISRLLATLEIEKAGVRKQLTDKEVQAQSVAEEKQAAIYYLQARLSQAEQQAERGGEEGERVNALQEAQKQKDAELVRLQMELSEKETEAEQNKKERDDMCTKLKLAMKGMESLQCNGSHAATGQAIGREKELEVIIQRQDTLIKKLSAVKEVPTVPHSSPSRTISPSYPITDAPLQVRSPSQPNRRRDISPTRIRSISPAAVLPPASPVAVPAAPPVAPESPKVAPPRYSTSIAPHPAEIQVLRAHLTSPHPDVERAAAEADALGYHGVAYWSENNCRRARVWMAHPPSV